MTQRLRRILIMTVMAILTVTLMTASLLCSVTYARYAGGRYDEEKSIYDPIIEFVGANQYEVYSPEELVEAIENGYSYIKIGENAEYPFVITTGVTDVTANLVIDLNGTTIVRNSRNPVLDVQRNVSAVLVYDSSVGEGGDVVEDAGSFYNPVGSALQVSGGTLTVAAGRYDSGPKTGIASSLPTESVDGATVEATVEATVWSRTSRTLESYSVQRTTLPKLTKDVYLPEDWTGTANGFVKADTYFIYSLEQSCYKIGDQLYVNAVKEVDESGTAVYTGDALSVPCNAASCDFYYYYPVDSDGNSTNTDGTQKSPSDYAVIYGYNDVKQLAGEEDESLTSQKEEGEINLVWPYAAVRSTLTSASQEERAAGGEGFMRGGAFSTYFGTANTYGIYAEGGTLTVADEVTFKAVGEGVCIRSQTTDAAVGSSDAASLEISGGSFSSETGDTIQMEGGAVKITGGAFEKNGSKARPSSGTLDEIEASRTALVHMRGGDLTIDGTVTGANYSVTMAAGSEQTPLTNVFGIYSEQSSLGDSGTVTVSGCDISVNGTYSAGVLSSAGTVNVGGTENGKPQTKITVAESIKDSLLTSSAVSSEGGIVNLRNTVIITSDSLGITARGTVNVIGGETGGESTTVTVTTSNATGVYVNNGTLNVDAWATLGVESTVKAELKWVTPPESSGSSDPVTQIYNGVFVHGGSLISNGTLNVTFKGVASDNTTGSNAYLNHQIRSHAVRVEQGTGTDTIVAIASGTILNGTRDTNDTVIAGSGIGGGVLVNGGTVYLGATVSLENSGNIVAKAVNNPVSVTTTGTANHGWNGVDFSTTNGEQRNNWDYRVTQTGGDAVKVVNGQLTVYGGSYTSSQGNGIAIQQTTGTATATVYGGTFSGDDVYSDNTQNDSFYTGPGASYAFKVLGGDLTIYDGRFISEDGGAFVMNGTATMYGGIIAAQGATAFVTYNGAEVTFDPVSELNVQDVPLTDRTLYVSGASTGLTVESVSGADQNISINGGVFTGGTYQIPIDGISQVNGSGADRNGIWYGNGNAKLTISGGTFQGENVSGLYFQVAPDENNVQLSGGMYYGKDNSLYGTEAWIFAWVITGVDNYTTNNAIAGNANLDSVLDAGYHAYGDTEFDPNSSVSGLDNVNYNCEDSTHGVAFGGIWHQLNNIDSKGEISLTRVQSTKLVYSCIVISQNTPATP